VPLLILDGWIVGSSWEERQVLDREIGRNEIFEVSLQGKQDAFGQVTI
jgi:hypothetical protein